MSDDIRDVRLTDFGFAFDVTKGEFDGEFRGSALYAAPEMLGRISCTEKGDIWSLGVTLFLMLTKTFPFPFTECDDPVDFIRRTLEDGLSHAKLNEVSANCADLLVWMLSLDPNDRPSADEARRHAWFAEFDHSVFERELPEGEASAATEGVGV
jgi:serine/threonine protein kinase